MVLCLGEPPRRFLLLLIFIFFLHLYFIFDFHFVVVLHLSMFFIHICFSTSSLTRPWTITGFLHPFYTFRPAHRRVIYDTLNFQLFRYLLTSWVGVFYLTLLHWHFTWVYRGLPGGRQFFLGVCRASYWWSSKHKPGPSVCLIHSNPPSSYLERFIFKFYHIITWITCGKKFSLYAPYSFRTLVACSKHICKGY